jgi:hypothetical protein
MADIVAKVEKLRVMKIDEKAGVTRQRDPTASPRFWESRWWRGRSFQWTPT